MTNKEDNAVVKDLQQFSVFKTFSTTQRAFSMQTFTNMFPQIF